MADNITPLIPLTASRLALMSPEDRAAYWNCVYALWSRADEAAHQLEFEAPPHRKEIRMIALDIHRVKSISALASSQGTISWVKMLFDGPESHFEFIIFFDGDKNRQAAEAYAAAINGAKGAVDEQRAA